MIAMMIISMIVSKNWIRAQSNYVKLCGVFFFWIYWLFKLALLQMGLVFQDDQCNFHLAFACFLSNKSLFASHTFTSFGAWIYVQDGCFILAYANIKWTFFPVCSFYSSFGESSRAFILLWLTKIFSCNQRVKMTKYSKRKWPEFFLFSGSMFWVDGDRAICRM